MSRFFYGSLCSLFRTKCSQDRIKTVYKTQKIDTQTKDRNIRKHKNTSKHATHTHALKIYKASLKN